MGIPIQNIYYLLCYAWNKLDEKDKVAVAIDDKTTLPDLFAKVLVNGSRVLLKRGIDKNYIDYKREISGIKGKVAVAETLQRNLLDKQKTICTFDELSSDVLTNQILVSTLRNLLKIKELDKAIKQDIRKLLYMFGGIKTIFIKQSHFRQIRFHRNNKFYQFLINVCQIIHENILPGEEPGSLLFSDFTRNKHQMNRLFERFLFNFYKKEQSKYRVKGDEIRWQFSAADELALNYLPLMKTDISLRSPEEKIIIDAKYYQETLSEYYDKKRIKSANLYQLFSYLLNQETDEPRTKKAKGILLYPTTSEEYNLDYTFGQHCIAIKTVNLNQHWSEIKARLLEIVLGEQEI